MDCLESDIDVKDMSKINKVIGFGTTLHKFTATNCDLLYVPDLFHHLPSADIHLFTPQAYQVYGDSSELDGNKVVMHLKQKPDISMRHGTNIPIHHRQSNLPIINNTACTKKELNTIGPHFKSAMFSFNHNLVFSDHWNVDVDEFKYKLVLENQHKKNIIFQN